MAKTVGSSFCRGFGVCQHSNMQIILILQVSHFVEEKWWNTCFRRACSTPAPVVSIPRNTARREKMPNSPVGRNSCLTQEETRRTKKNADALTKMPNIIWSPTMWFWAPCMIDAELVEQGFGEKTANTKFPLIPFPPSA